jgi:hypothetical protein
MIKIILSVVAALVVTVGALTITGAGDDRSGTPTMTTLPVLDERVAVLDERPWALPLARVFSCAPIPPAIHRPAEPVKGTADDGDSLR